MDVLNGAGVDEMVFKCKVKQRKTKMTIDRPTNHIDRRVSTGR